MTRIADPESETVKTVAQLREQLTLMQQLEVAEELFDQLLDDLQFQAQVDTELLMIIDLCLDSFDDHRFRKEDPGYELRDRLEHGWPAAG